MRRTDADEAVIMWQTVIVAMKAEVYTGQQNQY